MRRHLVLGIVGLVLAFGISIHWLVGSSLRGRVDQRIEERVVTESELLDRSLRLDALDLLNQVRDRAETRAVASVFAASDREARRARAHEAANAVSEWFGSNLREGRLGRPEVVLVADERGVVLARDSDPNRMYDERIAQKLPMIERVLREGRAASDIFSYDEPGLPPQQAAAAPIHDDRGNVRGALIVSCGLTDGALAPHAEALGRDLALVVEGRVVATTLRRGAASALEGAIAGELAGVLEKARVPRFDVSLAGEAFAGVASRLPYAEATQVKVVLLTSRDRAEQFASIGALVWPLTVAFAAVALVFAWIVANRVLFAVGEMEEGVLAIINGEVERTIQVEDDDFAGLAYRINQLVTAFAGEATDAPGERWGALESNLSGPGEVRSGGALPTEPLDDPELAAALGREPEDEYLARAYREYTETKRDLGEDVGQITAEKFAERLLASGRAMGEKHGCPVRFRVERHEGRVVLRPVLLREKAS